jgi:hypothetical protein
MISVGRVAYDGEMRNVLTFLIEKPERNSHFGDLGVAKMMLLKWTVKETGRDNEAALTF